MQLESFHQNKISKFLEGEGYFVTKLIKTNRAGIPDLIATKGTYVIWIEVKTQKGKTSKLQEYMHKKLRLQGGIVIVPYGYNDFLSQYNTYIKVKKV